MEDWKVLLNKAVRYINYSNLPKNEGEHINWSLGGGTVLMMNYHHRLSKDIDIFLSNPQYLGIFSPRLNDMIETETISYNEQAEYIKLRFDEGEIDFIVASRLLDRPYNYINKFNTDIPCDSPLETVAKKLFYRHQYFTVRDFFDLATVIHFSDINGLREIEALAYPYRESLEKRLLLIDSFDEISTLQNGEYICENGQKILSDFMVSMSLLKENLKEEYDQETRP